MADPGTVSRSVRAIRPSPVSGAALNGVSCITTAREAVGWIKSGTYATTLAARCDGTAWTTQGPPSPKLVSVLSGVSCADPTAPICMAVGLPDRDNTGTADKPLAERWSDSNGWYIT